MLALCIIAISIKELKILINIQRTFSFVTRYNLPFLKKNILTSFISILQNSLGGSFTTLWNGKYYDDMHTLFTL